MALLTWLGAYPVITIALGVLGPITTAWPLPLRTLLISGLMVAALTWGVLPALGYVLRGWLRGNR
jgi:antibiotic biosynthesis monooxygenase (ABM) superfamily enzyme